MAKITEYNVIMATMNKSAELLKIKQEMMDNVDLPLREGTNLVFGKGNPEANIIFIGEAAGKNEDEQGIPFVINSTGYSVTIAAIRAQVGVNKIHGSIGNRLVFGLGGSTQEELTEEELQSLVFDFEYPQSEAVPIYDNIKAVGRVELGITNEEDKATLLRDYIQKHFPGMCLAATFLFGKR